jgi:hypothetical protein
MGEKIVIRINNEASRALPVIKRNGLFIVVFILLSSIIGITLDNKAAVMGLISAHRIGLVLLVFFVLLQIVLQIILVGRLAETGSESLFIKDIILNHGLGVFIYATVNELVSGVDFFLSIYLSKKPVSLLWVCSQFLHLAVYLLLFLIWLRYFNKYRSIVYNQTLTALEYLSRNTIFFAIGAALYLFSGIVSAIEGYTWLSSVTLCMILVMFWVTIVGSFRSSE